MFLHPFLFLPLVSRKNLRMFRSLLFSDLRLSIWLVFLRPWVFWACSVRRGSFQSLTAALAALAMCAGRQGALALGTWAAGAEAAAGGRGRPAEGTARSDFVQVLWWGTEGSQPVVETSLELATQSSWSVELWMKVGGCSIGYGNCRPVPGAFCHWGGFVSNI